MKKRSVRWLVCWKLWMIKVFYRNACNITSTSKLPMTTRIKKGFRLIFVKSFGAKVRLVSKAHISHNRSSTSRKKSCLIGTIKTIISVRYKVHVKICWRIKIFISTLNWINSRSLNSIHKIRVIHRITWFKNKSKSWKR